MGRNWVSHTSLVGISNITAILKKSLAVSSKTKHVVAIQTNSSIPGIYSRELKTYGRLMEDLCTKIDPWMFIAALLVIAQTWKQHRCSPTCKWLSTQGYTHTMEYYLATQARTIESQQPGWLSGALNPQRLYTVIIIYYNIYNYILCDSTYVTFCLPSRR